MSRIILETKNTDSTIYCGKGELEKRLGSLIERKQTFAVTDSNVYRLYGEMIDDLFGSNVYVLPAGEANKNIHRLMDILKSMACASLKRSAVVVAFGGGVVGDIAGLAASLYMRGVDLVQVPTTLLAQVDSSVGGKTAVDFCGVKNLVGSFYQPQAVIVDPLFLDTLSNREIRCGLGEIIKYGALNAEIYKKLIENKDRLTNKAFLRDITYDCIRHKAHVVEEDERETSGARKTLNLGHTTGHAFEMYYKRKSHGEFVMIGAYYEMYIAVKKGICTPGYAHSLSGLIKRVITIPAYADADRACKAAMYDKKNIKADEISMIVPEREGTVAEMRLSADEYARMLCDCAQSINHGEGFI